MPALQPCQLSQRPWAARLTAIFALMLTGWLAPALAVPPDNARGGHGKAQSDHKSHTAGKHDQDRGEPGTRSGAANPGPHVQVNIGGYFGEQQRLDVQQERRSFNVRHCPPGLAKKGPGCLPPGQAKKAYSLGRPLPREVLFYELPAQVAVRLGPPPSGHRFVRVAADILLIAIGTGMVIDAIEDLGR